MDLKTVAWLAGALLAGFTVHLAVQGVSYAVSKRKAGVREEAAVSEEETAKEEAVKEETVKEEAASGEEAIREEAQEMEEAGREKEVKFIENPLPVPKKHVKKKMDFNKEAGTEDFDFQIKEEDDFDY